MNYDKMAVNKINFSTTCLPNFYQSFNKIMHSGFPPVKGCEASSFTARSGKGANNFQWYYGKNMNPPEDAMLTRPPGRSRRIPFRSEKGQVANENGFLLCNIFFNTPGIFSKNPDKGREGINSRFQIPSLHASMPPCPHASFIHSKNFPMKKEMFYLAAAIGIASCTKQPCTEEPVADTWNGYGKFLKAGEQLHTLWAGQNIDVGTVTYGIDENANFYATYDCSSSGWLISETHMFAGDKADMPLNKPGAPKIGLFPYSGMHDPWVSTFTYRVPLSQLPPCESPGFVVSSHGIVHSPAGQTETAWAEGDFTFSDKGWGWYDDYYFNTPPNQSTILYGTAMSYDTLLVYHLDVTLGAADLIFREYVGNSSGSYDGTAFDLETGMFFFTNYSTGELWANYLQGEDPSFCTGMLGGIAASGTFYDGSYYYVDEEQNTINRVTFTGNWTIASEFILDTIPNPVEVNDIAMSQAGDFLYITGRHNGNGTGLLSWEVATHNFYTMSLAVEEGAQLAFGSDNVLYAVAPPGENPGCSDAYILDISGCVLTEIRSEGIIFIEDPLIDLATGPIF